MRLLRPTGAPDTTRAPASDAEHGGFWAMRRDGDPRGALLAGFGLLVAGLLPYMSGRADLFHVATGGAIACVALACLGGYAADRTGRARSGGVVVALAAYALAWQVANVPGARRIVEHRFGADGGAPSEEVRHDGRSLLLTPTAAFSLQPVLDELGRLARPGQRLYVGPRDLRYAEYNDAYLYYHLLADLEPASFYLESNPDTVNGPRHDLSADLRGADFLVLNRDHDPDHPELDERRSAKPNRVVARDFCRLRRNGTFELFARRGTDACD